MINMRVPSKVVSVRPRYLCSVTAVMRSLFTVIVYETYLYMRGAIRCFAQERTTSTRTLWTCTSPRTDSGGTQASRSKSANCRIRVSTQWQNVSAYNSEGKRELFLSVFEIPVIPCCSCISSYKWNHYAKMEQARKDVRYCSTLTLAGFSRRQAFCHARGKTIIVSAIMPASNNRGSG